MRQVLSFVAVVWVGGVAAVAAPGSSFTYQGRLQFGGVPANGSFGLGFTLYDALSGGTKISATQAVAGVQVTNGLFSVVLNAGGEMGANVFDGGPRFIEITVNGTTLSPRQPVTPTPYATRAGSAEPFQVVGQSAYIASGVATIPPNSNCCTVHGSPGCTNIPCMTAVCTLDSYCCNVAWDQACVAQAQNLCGNCGAVSGTDRFLGFGVLGDLIGGAENTDAVGFERVNLNNDVTELRLLLGDNPGGGGAVVDYFTIGTNPAGAWNARFVFISDGNCQKPGGGTWAALSDARAKHDLAPMCGTLDKLLQLHGYSFEYNEDVITSGEGLPGRQIGLIAQEVERVFPDWVSQDRDGRKVVTERATTALMVESLRELREEKDQQIRQLKDQVASQQETIEKLMQRLERLESVRSSASAKP